MDLSKQWLLCLLPDPANLCKNKKVEETISKSPSKTFTTNTFILNRFQLAGYIKTVCLKHKTKLKNQKNITLALTPTPQISSGTQESVPKVTKLLLT